MTTIVYSTLGAGHSSGAGNANAGLQPSSPLLRQALASAAREDWVAAYHDLQQALENPADRRCAHYMLWEVCQALGHPDVALANLHAVLQTSPVTSRPAIAPRRRVLALCVPGDFQANLPLGPLLDMAETELHTLWLSDPEVILRQPLSAFGNQPPPPFDCIFIAIAEDVRHARALLAADRLAAELRVPVINTGARIAAVSRSGAAQLLQDLPDAVVPTQTLVARDALRTGAGLSFPVIIRPSDSHAGRGLRCIANSAILQDYLDEVGDSLFYVAPFIDYRSADGYWRKYRIIFVAGQPWPYHLAIHTDWAVWYYNARMDLEPWKRHEEAGFVADLNGVFPNRARAALDTIGQRTGLDYFGIDCGVLADGRLLVFEIETGMVVHDWDAPEVYPYKSRCAHAIGRAVETMLDRAIADAAVRGQVEYQRLPS